MNHPTPPEAMYVDQGMSKALVASLAAVGGLVAGIIICLVAANTVFAGGESHNLSDNVSEGPRNGIVTGVYEQELCVTLKSYTQGGRNDDHTSCASKSEVKNLGQEYSEGAVKAPKVDPEESQVLSVTAFEIKGGASGLLLGLPVSQESPSEEPPNPSPTVPAPELPATGSDGS